MPGAGGSSWRRRPIGDSPGGGRPSGDLRGGPLQRRRDHLKGAAKLGAIEERYGRGGFDYLGNGPEDLPIWEASASEPRRAARALADGPGPVDGEAPAGLRAARGRAPALPADAPGPSVAQEHPADRAAGHGPPRGEWPLLLAALVAFLAFSVGASSIYILNDLMDLPSDRLTRASGVGRWPRGRSRSRLAWRPGRALLTASIALACTLPTQFLGLLLLYLTTSLLYTLWFKRTLLLDVICLAGPVYPEDPGRRRGDRDRHHAVADGLLDVLLPQPGLGEAFHRAATPRASWAGTSSRAAATARSTWI